MRDEAVASEPDDDTPAAIMSNASGSGVFAQKAQREEHPLCRPSRGQGRPLGQPIEQPPKVGLRGCRYADPHFLALSLLSR